MKNIRENKLLFECISQCLTTTKEEVHEQVKQDLMNVKAEIAEIRKVQRRIKLDHKQLQNEYDHLLNEAAKEEVKSEMAELDEQLQETVEQVDWLKEETVRLRNKLADKNPEDEYDVRRYALYEDENDNFILLTTGCYAENYADGENLPELEELFACFDEGGCYDVIYSEMADKHHAVLFTSKWHRANPQCSIVEDEELYAALCEPGYFYMVGLIEDYMSVN